MHYLYSPRTATTFMECATDHETDKYTDEPAQIGEQSTEDRRRNQEQ